MRPILRSLARRARPWRRRLTVLRVEFAAEAMLCAAALAFLLTGGRARWLDRLWSHADAVAAVLCFALFVLLHTVVTRRLVPLVSRRFSPAPYDERRMLFDLSQEVHAANGIDELYDSVARRIAESLGALNVSIFVREELTGDYLCRVSSSLEETRPPSGPSASEGAGPQQEVRLGRDAFVVKRLRSLSAPLVVEPAAFDAWSKALASAPPGRRAAREREREALQKARAHMLVQVRTREQMVGILSLGLRRGQFRY